MEKDSTLPWSVLGKVKPKPTIINSAKTITTWLSNCIDNHGSACTKMGPNNIPHWNPTRLISLGRDNNDMRIVLSAGHPTVPYTAVSYCWGEPPTELTDERNLTNRLKKLDWTCFPRTHLDAVDLTREMGIKYIWIDSFCILQGDAQDWARESALMAEVYENALLVISAAHAGNVRLPLISQRKSTVLQNHLCHSSDLVLPQVIATKQIQHEPMAWNPKNRKHDWPMFTRGWTFQERFLATRVVHFAPDELIWECRSQKSCECGLMDREPGESGRSLVDKLFTHAGDSSPMLAASACFVWMTVLLVISDRVLSRDLDRLVALSGLAKRFAQLGLGQYFAGVWETALVPMLCWYPQDHGLLRRPRPYKLETSTYISPSWTWSSLVGPIWYDCELLFNLAVSTFYATVAAVTCQPTGPELYGAVSSGSITLSAPTLDVIYRADEANPILADDLCVSSRLIFDLEIPAPGTREGWAPAEVRDGDILKCLFIWTTNHHGQYGVNAAIALLLKHKSTTVQAGVYERVGIVDVRPWEHETLDERVIDGIEAWVGTLPEESVTIV